MFSQQQITDGFGPLLRKLSACYVALAVLGSALVSTPKAPVAVR